MYKIWSLLGDGIKTCQTLKPLLFLRLLGSKSFEDGF
jgi:hypothetical protein